MTERYIHYSLSVSIKALFVLAVLTSVAQIYQVMVVAGDYKIITDSDGPQTSNMQLP